MTSTTYHSHETNATLSHGEIVTVLRQRLATDVSRGLETLKIWNGRSVQRRQLASLDSRMLKDIGLSRVDADAEMRKPFWKP